MAQTLTGLTPDKRFQKLPIILLLLGAVVLLGGAGLSYMQLGRTEYAVVFTRPLVFGQQITADDVGIIEVPLHRPVQLAGITDVNQVVGTYATGDIRPDELAQPAMITTSAPDAPTYPSGKKLALNYVSFPYSTLSTGPISARGETVVNIGFTDTSGNTKRCTSNGGAASGGAVGPNGTPIAYSCRLVTSARVLHVDDTAQIAYLELTPYQASLVRALMGDEEVSLYAEAYGVKSTQLPYASGVEAQEFDDTLLTAPASATLQLLPGVPAQIPGAVQR